MPASWPVQDVAAVGVDNTTRPERQATAAPSGDWNLQSMPAWARGAGLRRSAVRIVQPGDSSWSSEMGHNRYPSWFGRGPQLHRLPHSDIRSNGIYGS